MATPPNPSTTSPTPRRKRRRRWTRKLAKGLLALTVLVGLLYAFRQPLFGRWVADEVGKSLSEVLGVPVRVERVLGTWVTNARVEQIAVDTDQTMGVLAGFDADAVVVRFDLWEVLFGDAIGGIESVEADNLRLHLDFTRTTDSADDTVPLEDIVQAVPRKFPLIRIDAQVTARTGAGGIEVQDVEIFSAGDDVLSLEAAQVILPRPAGIAGRLDARIRRTTQGLQWQSDSVVAGLVLSEFSAGEDGAMHAQGVVADARFEAYVGKNTARVRTDTMKIEAVPPWVLRLLPSTVLRPTSGSLQVQLDASSLEPLHFEAQVQGADIQLPDEHVSTLRARATVTPDRLTVSELHVKARDTSLRADHLVLRTEPSLRVVSLRKVDLSVGNLAHWITLDRPLAVELHADTADASRVRIRSLTAKGPGVDLSATGTVDVPEDLDLLDAATFQAHVEGTLADGTYGPLTVRGQLSFQGEASGTLGAPSIAGQVRGTTIQLNGHAIDRLDVEGTWRNEQVSLSRIDVQSADAIVQGTAQFTLEPFALGATDVQFDVKDAAALKDWVPSLALPPVQGALRGTARLRGTPEDLHGTLSLQAETLHVAGHDIGTARIDATARGADLDVTRADITGPWGALQASGALRLKDHAATIRTLTGQVHGHTMALRQPASVTFGDVASIGDLDLEALGGTVAGTLALSEPPRGTLRFENITLDGLAIEGLRGRASGTVTATAQEQRLDATLVGLTLRNHPLQTTVRVTQRGDDGLHVERLDIDGGDTLRATARGRLPWRLTPSGWVDQAVGDASFVLDATTDDASRWFDVPVGAARVQATATAKKVEATLQAGHVEVIPGLAPLAKLTLTTTIRPDGIDATGQIEDPRLSGTIQGGSTTGWAWTKGQPPDVAALPVNAALDVALHDAAALVPLLPDVAVDAQGTLTGRLTATGRLDALVLNGEVHAQGARVRLRDVANFVDLTRLEARLIEDKLRVTRIGLRYELGSRAPTPEPTRPPVVIDPEDLLDVPEMVSVQETLAALRDVTGTLEGDVSILNVPHNPSLDGWVRGRDLFLALPQWGTSARLEALDIALQGDRATVQPARVTAGPGHAVIRGWLAIPMGQDTRNLGDMPMEATVEATAPDIRALGRLLPAVQGVRGSAKGTVHLRHTIHNPSLTGEVTAKDVHVPLPALDATLRIASITATADETHVRVRDAKASLGKATASLNATLATPPRWLDDWRGQELDAHVQVDVGDLGFLKDLSTDFKHIRGKITGDVKAKGPLTSPALTGHVDLDNVHGALPGALPSLDQLSGRVHFAGRTVRIERMRGALGHAPFTLGGTATIPEEGTPTVDLRLQGQNLRLVQTRDMRLRADMDLRLAGPTSTLQASGSVRIADLVYRASMDLLGGGPETSSEGLDLFTLPWEPLASAKLDVAIRADDTIRIRTNVLRGNLSAEGRFLGTGRAPLLVGRVSANNFFVQLPFSSLEVERGEARFTEADPNNPAIDASARTEIKGYDMTVRAVGRLPDPEIRTASVPPLRDSDAILLLTTGATNDELRTQGLARSALTRIGNVFGRSLFTGGRGPRDGSERGFFDRFSFRQGRHISRTGQETLEAEFEMSDRVYLRVEQDRFDDFNAGVVWRWRFR